MPGRETPLLYCREPIFFQSGAYIISKLKKHPDKYTATIYINSVQETILGHGTDIISLKSRVENYAKLSIVSQCISDLNASDFWVNVLWELSTLNNHSPTPGRFSGYPTLTTLKDLSEMINPYIQPFNNKDFDLTILFVKEAHLHWIHSVEIFSLSCKHILLLNC